MRLSSISAIVPGSTPRSSAVVTAIWIDERSCVPGSAVRFDGLAFDGAGHGVARPVEMQLAVVVLAGLAVVELPLDRPRAGVVDLHDAALDRRLAHEQPRERAGIGMRLVDVAAGRRIAART